MEWDLGDGNPGKGNTAAQLWNSLVKFVPAPTATAEFEARAVESAGTLRVITNRITKHPEIIYSISSTASSAAVDLCIYDMLGVRVFKIALGHHSPGTYSVVIDKDVMGGRPLSPGNYVVKMALASKTETAIVSFVR
jgi:flagellar hook assembly protein FlgD